MFVYIILIDVGKCRISFAKNRCLFFSSRGFCVYKPYPFIHIIIIRNRIEMHRFHHWCVLVILLIVVSYMAEVHGAAAGFTCCVKDRCVNRSNSLKTCLGSCRCTSDADCALSCCPPVIMIDQAPCCDCGFRG